MRRTVVSIASGVAVAAALIAGCDDDGASAKRSQSIEQFRASAEPICRSVSADIAKIELPSSFPAKMKDFDEKSQRMLRVIEKPFTELASMDPPTGKATAYASFSAALNAAVRETKQIRALVEAGNDDTDALWLPRTNVATHQAQAMNLAPELGLESCGELNYKEGKH